MASLAAIAQSGLQAAQSRLNASAHNVANLNTPGFNAQRVREQAERGQRGVQAYATRAGGPGGVVLERELAEQWAAGAAFKANLFVLRTANDTLGTLLDAFA